MEAETLNVQVAEVDVTKSTGCVPVIIFVNVFASYHAMHVCIYEVTVDFDLFCFVLLYSTKWSFWYCVTTNHLPVSQSYSFRA